jgi:DNA-binding IclR family transcriptional regulator
MCENELKEPPTLQLLRQFLFDRVTSYDEIEALLWLQKNPGHASTITEIASALGLSRAACLLALENLAAQGLLALGEEKFRYAPANEELAAAAEQLRRFNSEDRFAIVQLMTTNAMDRVRAAAVSRFALPRRPRMKLVR